MKAIIIDIDGTIANFDHRFELLREEARQVPRIFEKSQEASANDPVYPWCANLAKVYSDAGYHIIFLTARNERYYDSTAEWLNKNLDPSIVYSLYMRPLNDERPDEQVKKDVYQSLIEPTYDIEFALDDRDGVVDMWRNDVGLPCLQVQRGKY